jgi:alginate lyase
VVKVQARVSNTRGRSKSLVRLVKRFCFPAHRERKTILVLSCLAGIWPATSASSAEKGMAITAAGTNLTLDVVAPAPPPLRIQSSTDLLNWSDWNLVTNTAACFSLGNGYSTNSGRCFFRLTALSFDLTNWKLTLPVDTSHAGTPDEIQQPELAGFEEPLYFHMNVAGNGRVFAAPCGGISTSGSGYPRSELREMTQNGQIRASWTTTSGTHTMEIVQAITHLPAVKPHVVAGQIHDATNDVVVFRLEGQKLFIDQNGVQGPILTSQYHSGDVFSVKCVARNSGIECYYNGRYVYTYAVAAACCYFKAGCYTQSNTSTGDLPSAYGEVVIYGLSVTHEP